MSRKNHKWQKINISWVCKRCGGDYCCRQEKECKGCESYWCCSVDKYSEWKCINCGIFKRKYPLQEFLEASYYDKNLKNIGDKRPDCKGRLNE